MIRRNNATMTQFRTAASLAGLTAVGLVLAGCAVGPNYARPAVTTTATAFKEAEGWKQAEPSDAVSRSDWWTVFNDPVLNALEAKVLVSNQNLIAAEAAYRQAHALLDQQRSTLFPTVTLTGGDTQSKSASVAFTSSGTAQPGRVINQYTARLGATWSTIPPPRSPPDDPCFAPRGRRLRPGPAVGLQRRTGL